MGSHLSTSSSDAQASDTRISAISAQVNSSSAASIRSSTPFSAGISSTSASLRATSISAFSSVTSSPIQSTTKAAEDAPSSAGPASSTAITKVPEDAPSSAAASTSVPPTVIPKAPTDSPSSSATRSASVTPTVTPKASEELPPTATKSTTVSTDHSLTTSMSSKTSSGTSASHVVTQKESVSTTATSTTSVDDRVSTSSTTSSSSTSTSVSTTSSQKPTAATPPLPATSRTSGPPGTSTTAKNLTSTSLSVTKVTAGPSTTLTSTLTDKPESTFSVPVSITVTNSANGKVAVSAPPLITQVSTSIEKDGSSTVLTHIIANPTSNFNESRPHSSLLQNQGATAGVFLVVGVVVAALLFGIFWLCRRRRRRAQQGRWLATIPQANAARDSNPFVDPPEMRLFGDADTRPLRSVVTPNYDSDTPVTGRMEGVGTNRWTPPFSDYHYTSNQQGVGLAVTTDQVPFDPTVSQAHSSPSLYPASLPPAEDEEDKFYGQELSSVDHTRHNRSHSITSDIQAPSPTLQYNDIQRKVPPSYLPSPPASTAGSHHLSTPPTPVTELSNVFVSRAEKGQPGMPVIRESQSSPVLFTKRTLRSRPSAS